MYLKKLYGIALVTRVAMETPKNRRLTNMDPVAIGTCKTFQKCIRSVVQVCNGKEIRPRTPGYTSNFGGEFFPSGEIRACTS